MTYTSIDNQKIKDIKKLHNKKYRDKKNLFLVEGEHLVLEAYKKGYLKTLILDEDAVFPLDVDTMYVTNNIISYISTLETPYRVLGVCNKIRPKDKLENHLLILEDIQDPGNLGTIIRSAVAFNIDTLVLSSKSVDLYNSKVIRASQGMIFHLNIIERELLSFIPELISNHYNIMGTRVTHGKSVKKLEKSAKFAIIMGNEGNGLSEEVGELCDEFIYIDMNDACESLNVGVATSIILYELDK
ncbi:MAG: RNA methyltransferase [Bacilli bacterium]|nr:RNA methyltransferase [Bacilli bacterium]